MVQNTTLAEELPDILDSRIIASYLNIGYAKALNLIKFSGIPYIKLGNTYRVSKGKFIAFLNTDTQTDVTLN